MERANNNNILYSSQREIKELAVHKVRRLQQETGKAVTGQVKGKVPDTSSFFIFLFILLTDRSNLPEPYV